MERQNYEKTQLLIFLGVAFALPYILGILMGIGYSKGLDVSVFPSARCSTLLRERYWLL